MLLTSGETDLIPVDSPVSLSFIYHIINAILCIIIGGNNPGFVSLTVGAKFSLSSSKKAQGFYWLLNRSVAFLLQFLLAASQ